MLGYRDWKVKRMPSQYWKEPQSLFFGEWILSTLCCDMEHVFHSLRATGETGRDSNAEGQEAVISLGISFMWTFLSGQVSRQLILKMSFRTWGSLLEAHLSMETNAIRNKL